MQKIQIYEYYRFGYNYFILRNRTEGKRLHGEYNSLVGLIDEFLGYLRELNLFVTSKAAERVRRISEKVLLLPKEQTVDKDLANEVEEAFDTIDTTLDAELQLRSAFVVTPKRFQLEQLLETPYTLFATNVFTNFPEICKFDFKEGCRCLAFGMPTSAAFHFMRGTEGALRNYYQSIVKRNRVKRLMWYDVVNHLRQRRDAPPKPLLDSLDNIRINFRNPTQHPDARYDMDEAQDLLLVCIDAANRMARDLAKRSA